jgi:hypothetical protein
MKKYKIIFLIICLLAICIIAFGAYQVITLKKAHGTLANYATFRGCSKLNNQTATSADCVLNSGQIIKLVQINNKWYLEGDGPGIW